MPVPQATSIPYIYTTPVRVQRPSDRPYVALGIANAGSASVTVRIGPDTWPISAQTQTVLPLPAEQVPITVAATEGIARVTFTWYLPSDLEAANAVGGSVSQYQTGPIPGPPNETYLATGTVTTAGDYQLAMGASPPSYTDLLVLSNTGADTLQWYLEPRGGSGTLGSNSPPPASGTPPYFTQAAGAPPIILPLGGTQALGVWVTSTTAGAAYAVLFSGT